MFDTFFYTTMHPALYHGHGRGEPYFEGWYFKLVSADESRRYAIIPGVSLSGEAHAFVQVLDGVTGATAYHRYPLADFQAAPDRFMVRVGPNWFTNTQIHLDIDRPEGQLAGELRFSDITPWPVTWAAPGVMGWYAWVPKMECYHGVLSLHHAIKGALRVDGQSVDFSGGIGYTEKDWGASFPAAWVWLQTNHFDRPRISLTGSVAIIPWLRRAFAGFIVGLWHNGVLHRFTTYVGAQIEDLQIADDHVVWQMRNRRERLTLRATRAHGGALAGPTRLDMGQRVNETLNATVEVHLSTLDGMTLLHTTGRHAGLEVVGDLPRLFQMTK